MLRRDSQASRLEAFSDAVFAFAPTLLVVSLEVPSGYQELIHTMRGFLPFACTFAIVTWQVPSLLAIYSAGFVVLFLAFALLYHHAWQRREAPGLDEIAVFEARAGIVAHLLSASISAISVLLALTPPTRWAWLAGPFYFVMAPVHDRWGARVGRETARLQTRAAPATAAVAGR